MKYLQPQFNVVLYDQPYAGRSKPHNDHSRPITKETEAEILLELIEHYQADYLSSFSWGGVATLLALGQSPARIKKAVINSFSPILNEPMLDYMKNGMNYLQAVDRENVGALVNDTIGRYLPALFAFQSQARRQPRRARIPADALPYPPGAVAGRQLLRRLPQGGGHPAAVHQRRARRLHIPKDARLFAEHVRDCQFETIRNAGHFIDLEHKAGWLQTQQVLLGFLNAPASTQQPRHLQPQPAQAMAV